MMVAVENARLAGQHSPIEPLATLLAWVSEARFQSVDCFWRYLGMTIFGGINTKSITMVDPDLFARAAI